MAASESILTSSYTYLPSTPPSKAIKPSYSRFLLSAPVTALAEVTPHAKIPNDYPNSSYSRRRVQVGNTNRWRLPNALGSDLLGTSQAIKAVNYSKVKEKKEHQTAYSSRHFRSLNVAPSCSEFDANSCTSKPQNLVQDSASSILSRSYLPSHDVSSTNNVKSQRDKETFQDEQLSTIFLDKIHKQISYVSPEQQKPTPMEKFLHISQLASNRISPDVAVDAFNFTWYLHGRNAAKSGLLSKLIRQAEPINIAVQNDPVLNHNGVPPDVQGVTVSIQKFPAYPSYKNNVVALNLDVDDKLISKHAFANALCALYGDYNFNSSDVIGILAASHLLEMEDLKDRCADLLIQEISASNACIFHAAAKKYDLPSVNEYCEKWLELNLVPLMSSHICLSHLTLELLERLLKSQHLFTYNEYALFKMLCNWTFLKLHPNLQTMPFWGTVVTWFMSIPKTMSFLEQDEGKKYRGLFNTLRLNGITNPGQLDEITKMNVLPADWLLKVFSQHYYSLQGGGDMSLMTRFETGAIRYGFILDQPNTNCKEVISLHGFHYDMRAELGENYYIIYMQRLRPTDPVISQRVSERQTFSVRQDREVRYSIKAQFRDGEMFQTEIIGPKSQCFGLNNKSERSEALKVKLPALPLYVTFYLLFPPS